MIVFHFKETSAFSPVKIFSGAFAMLAMIVLLSHDPIDFIRTSSEFLIH